jgi:hypothetical protein
MVTSSCKPNMQLEQSICDWLEMMLQEQGSEATHGAFQRLLMEGKGAEEPTIAQAVEDIALNKDKGVERDFVRILDRAIHYLVTHWLIAGQTDLISQLIDEVGLLAAHKEPVYAKLHRRLQQHWKTYSQESYFQRLRKLQIIATQRSNDPNAIPVVANLLDRYPFLYESNLLAEDASKEYLEIIQKCKRRAQRDYEFRFSQYLTYQIRKAYLRQNPDPHKSITVVSNPTLLKSRDLGTAIKSFIGKHKQSESYWDGACEFQALAQPSTMTFAEFKEHLYRYLVKDLPKSKYTQASFKPKLKDYLRSILPENHSKPLDELSQVRTYTQLLNFLLIDSAERPNHVMLIDSLSNFGSTATVGIILKVILICPKAQTSLNHRLSILFNHYYNSPQAEVPWLIKLLENWHIASSIHFGKVDTSMLKQILTIDGEASQSE